MAHPCPTTGRPAGRSPAGAPDREPARCGPQLGVLGRFRLTRAGIDAELPVPVTRLLALLAVLGHPESRLTAAATLWMDVTDHRAAANLRTTLWKCRELAGECLVIDHRTVGLAPAVAVDVHRMVGQCQRLLRAGAPLRPGDLDVTALTGDLLPTWDETWLTYERERLRQLRIHALEAISQRLSHQGEHGPAVDAGHAAVAAEPLRESAHRTLIAAHLAEGNLVEAWRQYERCAALIRRELQVGPSDELRALLATASPRHPGA